MAEILKRQIVTADVEFDTEGLGSQITCPTSTGGSFQGYAINASHIPLPLSTRPNVGDSADIAEALENIGGRVNSVEIGENAAAIASNLSALAAATSENNALTYATSCVGAVTLSLAAKDDIEASQTIIQDIIENTNINTVNLELGDRFVGTGHLDYGSRF